MHIDLSSLASVRAFATAFHERFATLDDVVAASERMLEHVGAKLAGGSDDADPHGFSFHCG
jgi:hypothetical protein